MGTFDRSIILHILTTDLLLVFVFYQLIVLFSGIFREIENSREKEQKGARREKEEEKEKKKKKKKKEGKENQDTKTLIPLKP